MGYFSARKNKQKHRHRNIFCGWVLAIFQQGFRRAPPPA
jgi:hypothetical protein